MKVVVLGGGVIGVTSAWYLASLGHEVHDFGTDSAEPVVGSWSAVALAISVHVRPRSFDT